MGLTMTPLGHYEFPANLVKQTQAKNKELIENKILNNYCCVCVWVCLWRWLNWSCTVELHHQFITIPGVRSQPILGSEDWQLRCYCLEIQSIFRSINCINQSIIRSIDQLFNQSISHFSTLSLIISKYCFFCLRFLSN